MRSAPKAVLVTGATGFIGGYVVKDLLENGFVVYALSRTTTEVPTLDRRARVIKGDITETFDLPEGISAVYHCAGVISEADRMEAVNVDGTRRVANAALRQNCRLIHLSSAGVVGVTKEMHIDEDTQCRPRTLYEKTKLQAETIVGSGINAGLKAQILRPTIVFGTGRIPEQDSFLRLVKAITNGRYGHIRGGQGIFNIIYAGEVARAMRALDDDSLPIGGKYFINTPITFRDFFAIVGSTFVNRNSAPDIPYPIALCAALSLSVLGAAIGRKMPLTLSRFRILTEKRTFSQKRLIATTRYRPLFDLDHHIRVVCDEYAALGLTSRKEER